MRPASRLGMGVAVLGAAIGCTQALTLTRDDSPTVLSHQTIMAPNPGDRGTFTVRTMYYGNGTDKQRAVYRDSVTLKTRTVDAGRGSNAYRPSAKPLPPPWAPSHSLTNLRAPCPPSMRWFAHGVNGEPFNPPQELRWAAHPAILTPTIYSNMMLPPAPSQGGDPMAVGQPHGGRTKNMGGDF